VGCGRSVIGVCVVRVWCVCGAWEVRGRCVGGAWACRAALKSGLARMRLSSHQSSASCNQLSIRVGQRRTYSPQQVCVCTLDVSLRCEGLREV
jgi:hypothetical protein